MSAIINFGENLVLERQASVAQTKTQGGRRRAQKRGPLLYNLEVQVPAKRLNGNEYFLIEEEVLTLEYGQETFESANISGLIGGNMTSHRGVWSSGDNPTVDGIAQTGSSITLKSTTGAVTNYVRAFDYIQFSGCTKVYQATADADKAADGTFTVSLNSPLVVSPGNNSVVVLGGDVSFNFAMVERPATSYQPGEIIQYGTFKFEEVIENVSRATANQSNPPSDSFLSTQLFNSASLAAAATTGTPTYSGWVIKDQDDVNGENIGSEDEVTFTGANGINTSYNQSTNVLTITGTDDNNTTYTTSVVDDSGIKIRLTDNNTPAGTDDITVVGSGSVSVSRTDASTITISSTAADDALAFAIALG